MKHLLTLLAALAILAAPAAAQTMKALMFNSTNGQVVANTTNALEFTNAISVPALVLPRTSYNTNVALGFYTTNTVPGVYTNVSVYGFAWANANSGRLSYYHNTAEVMVIDGELIRLREPVSFLNSAAAETTRTNLGLGLPALTNTSNVTAMRALGGSTNTNEPYSGTVALTNTNVLTFSNGVLLKIQ